MDRSSSKFCLLLLTLSFLARCSANDVAAHMLGVPPPSVQTQRHADLMRALPTASILVLPIYFADRDQWMPADAIAALLEPLARDVVLQKNAPNVRRSNIPPTSYRYWGKRTAQYRKWLASDTPSADYVFIPEIYTQHVLRAQIFVLSRDGTLVHGSSVHWGQNPPDNAEDAAERIVSRFCSTEHMQPGLD